MNNTAPTIMMPSFKPTKWKIDTCQDCTFKLMQDMSDWHKEQGIPDMNHSYYCSKEKHNIISRDNLPFFVPDMKIKSLGYKGWVRLKSDTTGRGYDLGPTKLEEIILNTTIVNGLIANQWWMYCKLGSSFSLRLVK